MKLSNDVEVQATSKGQVPLHPSLSPAATQAHVFPGITNSSLISIGQLCDDNYVAVLDKQTIHIFKDKQVILTGSRNPLDGLWDIKLPSPT